MVGFGLARHPEGTESLLGIVEDYLRTRLRLNIFGSLIDQACDRVANAIGTSQARFAILMARWSVVFNSRTKYEGNGA